MSAHTPTPWSVHPYCSLELAERNKVALGHQLSYEPGAFQVFTDDGRGNGLPLSEQDREANAAHIVRCVNSHAALVEALQLVVDKLGSDHELYREQQFAIDTARAALKQAGAA